MARHRRTWLGLAMALAAGAIAAFGMTCAAWAQPTGIGGAQRVALVIGNAGYTKVDPLKNAETDARSIAAKLETLGFRVTPAYNVGRRDMIDVIGRFVEEIPREAEVLIYYAGHGVELSGSNYLLPVDIPDLEPGEERYLRSEAINLTELLEEVGRTSARATLVILDACRNNPYSSKRRLASRRSLGGTRGLADVSNPTGTFVMFSAGVGQTALDNLGPQDPNPNGLYTRKLLEAMDRPGLEIREMAVDLRAEVGVAALTFEKHQQTPAYYDQMLGKFYFRPKAPAAEKPAQPVRRADDETCLKMVDPAADRATALAGDAGAAVQACAAAIGEFPEDRRFHERLSFAREQKTAQGALASQDRSPGDAYLILFPRGRFADDVRRHVAALQKVIDDAAEKAAPVAPEPVVQPPTPAPLPKEDKAKTAVAPDARKDAKSPEADPAASARGLQAELKRLGCFSGAESDRWGVSSVMAATRFNVRSGTKIDTRVASLSSIEVLRGMVGRVCPQACGKGETLRNDVCVRISPVVGPKRRDPPRDTRRREVKKTTPRAEPQNKCRLVGGVQFCE